MFVINAIPMPTNRDCEDIAGAKVHIWVMAEDIESAKIRALQDIESYHWYVISVVYELDIQPEQLSNLPESEAMLYRKALLDGIAADYLAYPIEQDNLENRKLYR